LRQIKGAAHWFRKRCASATEARTIAATKRSVEQRLVETARESGADLLVAGAYSHSRVRELVFGGFTSEVLTACDLPILLLH